jgi:hypothetical protein
MVKRINYLTDLILRVARIATIIIGIFLVVTVKSWSEIIAVTLICAVVVLTEGFLIKRFGVVHPSRSSSNREESE